MRMIEKLHIVFVCLRFVFLLLYSPVQFSVITLIRTILGTKWRTRIWQEVMCETIDFVTCKMKTIELGSYLTVVICYDFLLRVIQLSFNRMKIIQFTVVETVKFEVTKLQIVMITFREA